ncbi:MAG TPA: hypothetical protein VII84_07815 [Acidimicrobiales bacterium]
MNDEIKPPLTTTTSIWPAAAVLILAVVVLAVFMAINIVSNQGVSTTSTTIPVVVGALGTDPVSTVLQDCHQPANPPSDIASALIVPTSTRSAGPPVLPNAGAGDFDCYRPLVTQASAGSLLAYYAAHLETLGWSLFSKGSSSGSPQSLFQKGGSDGFYWIVGITVNSSTKAGSAWTYKIYQNSETI